MGGTTHSGLAKPRAQFQGFDEAEPVAYCPQLRTAVARDGYRRVLVVGSVSGTRRAAIGRCFVVRSRVRAPRNHVFLEKRPGSLARRLSREADAARGSGPAALGPPSVQVPKCKHPSEWSLVLVRRDPTGL